MRICSLLPSSTEIVYALGLGDSLVGITHECDYPPKATKLPAVTHSLINHAGSTSREIHNHITSAVHGGSSIYGMNQALLKKLNPDLILTQELCEVCAVSYGEVRKAARLLPGDRKILSLEPTSLRAILETIKTVGEATGTQARAKKLVADLQARIDKVASATKNVTRRPKVFALEWLDPPFIGGHWVPEMIRLAGGFDGMGKEGRHSVTTTWKEIADYNPEVVVLMPCGYHLGESLAEVKKYTWPPEWKGLKAVRNGQVYAVDGSSYYNRPGPRVVDGLEILAEILHPELFPRKHTKDDWGKL